MKRSSRELKGLARESLQGHYSTLIGATVLHFIITSLLELIPQYFLRGSRTTSAMVMQLVVSMILGILTYLLQIGIVFMVLQMTRGYVFGVGDLFHAFRHHPDRFIIVGVIEVAITLVLELPAILFPLSRSLFSVEGILLYLLLFLAGTIIAFILLLGFALCEMLLLDNDDMGAIESIRESFSLMRGNKGRYFYLELSFFGLSFLSMLSLGIGMLWLVPYMITTEVFFYMDVCGELDHPHVEDSSFDSAFPDRDWNTFNSGNGYGSNTSYGSDSYSYGGSDSSYGQSSNYDNYDTKD